MQHHAPEDVSGQLRAVISELNRKFREHSSIPDMTRSQATVVGYLDRHGATSTADLARAHGMRHQSMATIISALTAANLIVGHPAPTDGRKILLDLTESARAEIDAGRLERTDWLTHAIEMSLRPEEVGQLAETLTLLQRIAAQP